MFLLFPWETAIVPVKLKLEYNWFSVLRGAGAELGSFCGIIYGLERGSAPGASCCELLTAILLLLSCWRDDKTMAGFRICSHTPPFLRAVMSNMRYCGAETNKSELRLGFSHLWFDKKRRKTDISQPQQISCVFVLLFTTSSWFLPSPSWCCLFIATALGSFTKPLRGVVAERENVWFDCS